ncbi:hypothetical protein P9112_011382 [Eukaryota sp. TZLM1-RC]
MSSSEYHKGRIYIGNVSDDIDDATLRELFSPHGNVISTKTGLCGFAFVDFENDEDVDKAVEALNGTEFNSKRITVERARGPRRRRDTRMMRDYPSSRRSSSYSRSSRPRRSSFDEDDRDRYRHKSRDSRSPSPKRSSHYGPPYPFMGMTSFPPMYPPFMPPSQSFAPDRERGSAPMMPMFNPYMMSMAQGGAPDPKQMEHYTQMMYQQGMHPQHPQDEGDIPAPIGGGSEHGGWPRSPTTRSPSRHNW